MTSHIMEKALIVGVSSALGIFAAHRSRKSRSQAQEQQEDRLYEAKTHVAHTWTQVHGQHTTARDTTNSATHHLSPFTATATNSQTQNNNAAFLRSLLLLLHTLLSIFLIAYNPSLPHYYTPLQEIQPYFLLQLTAAFLLTTLSLHAAFLALAPLLHHHHNNNNNKDHRSKSQKLVLAAAPSLLSQDGTTSIQYTRKLHDINALNGVWLKDKNLSDSMDAACDLIELKGIVRMAVNLVKGLEISVKEGEGEGEEGEFRFAVLSGVLWFKITERYPLSGVVKKHRRRDLRGGGAFGRVEKAPSGGIYCNNRFSEPLAGSVQEHFYCPLPNLLHVDTVMSVRGKSVSYRQVYHKQ